jgi:hypothetical protein
VASLKHSTPVVKPVLTITLGGKSYGVESIPPGGFGDRAWRLSGPEGQVYDVIRTHFGIVECDCPSYEFRLKGNCITPCKHGAALIAVGLLQAPEPVEAPAADEWAAHDDERWALGPAAAADRAWHDAQTRPAADEFANDADGWPVAREPARRQRRPVPTQTGLDDADIADATGACG